MISWLAAAKLWPWKLIAKVGAVAVVIGLIWWQIHAYGERRYDAGVAANEARHVASDAKATKAHNDRIEEINRDHAKELKSLQSQRDAALARPAVRTIRVPVAAICSRESPADASVPARVDPQPEHVDVVDEGYGVFRDWLIRFAATPSRDGG